MNFSYVKWKDSDAIKFITPYCELIIGISAGPRIVSLSYSGGANLLYDDTTGFGVGAWRLYGGHRFTIAPENESSYYPDNETCSVNIAGEVVIISAPTRADDLRLSIKVSELSSGAGFELVHILENYGSLAWSGALWAITCIPRPADIMSACSSGNIRYWPGTESSNWISSDGVIAVKAGPFRGKAGWHENHGWLSATQDGVKLTIQHQEKTDAANCADEGCNLEIFVCKDWIELETLGTMITVEPGRIAQHVQHWLIPHVGSIAQLI
ncbi:MAG: hypothetical protein EOP51_22040 [Sphingobacteriales bacterium]|nr:MAG: hypothetical protein EOP51_22040 [Sphingobacteriales bacterium]